MDSDTTIGHQHEDATHALFLVSGQPLRVAAGPMKGLTGVFVDRQPGGALRIRVGCGMYVEVSELCVSVPGERKRA
jgi:hypothetical protein